MLSLLPCFSGVFEGVRRPGLRRCQPPSSGPRAGAPSLLFPQAGGTAGVRGGDVTFRQWIETAPAAGHPVLRSSGAAASHGGADASRSTQIIPLQAPWQKLGCFQPRARRQWGCSCGCSVGRVCPAGPRWALWKPPPRRDPSAERKSAWSLGRALRAGAVSQKGTRPFGSPVTAVSVQSSRERVAKRINRDQ